MGYTERRFLVAMSIVFLLAASAATAAASAASDATAERSWSASASSPTTFAERAVAGGSHAGRETGSWQSAVELIALAGTCAIAVAFYSAVTAQRTDTQVPVRIRRR
jgi:hypothetical protein